MKFYLSSFKIGNNIQALHKLLPSNKKVAYIPNAVDFEKYNNPYDTVEQSGEVLINELKLDLEILDLKQYFRNKEKLELKLEEFGMIWIRGGNTFVLRQAMKLSGFDNIIKKFYKEKRDILYGGYSAGACVLARKLNGLQFVDDIDLFPYLEMNEIIWEGLNFINYTIVPHYKSDHPESKKMDKVINYLIENKILFKALKDGEVITF